MVGDFDAEPLSSAGEAPDGLPGQTQAQERDTDGQADRSRRRDGAGQVTGRGRDDRARVDGRGSCENGHDFFLPSNRYVLGLTARLAGEPDQETESESGGEHLDYPLSDWTRCVHDNSRITRHPLMRQ